MDRASKARIGGASREEGPFWHTSSIASTLNTYVVGASRRTAARPPPPPSAAGPPPGASTATIQTAAVAAPRTGRPGAATRGAGRPPPARRHGRSRGRGPPKPAARGRGCHVGPVALALLSSLCRDVNVVELGGIVGLILAGLVRTMMSCPDRRPIPAAHERGHHVWCRSRWCWPK